MLQLQTRAQRARLKVGKKPHPRSEAAVIQHFQLRMPYGLFVPDAEPQ
jgi:hypothetical protein